MGQSSRRCSCVGFEMGWFLSLTLHLCASTALGLDHLLNNEYSDYTEYYDYSTDSPAGDTDSDYGDWLFELLDVTGKFLTAADGVIVHRSDFVSAFPSSRSVRSKPLFKWRDLQRGCRRRVCLFLSWTLLGDEVPKRFDFDSQYLYSLCFTSSSV